MENKQLPILSLVVLLISGCTNGLQPLTLPVSQQVQANSIVNRLFPGQIKEIDIKHSENILVPGSIYHVIFANKSGGEDFIGLNLDMEKTSTKVIRNYGSIDAEVYYLDKEGRPVKDVITDLEKLLKEFRTLKPNSAAEEEKLDEMVSVIELYTDTLKMAVSLNSSTALKNAKQKVTRAVKR